MELMIIFASIFFLMSLIGVLIINHLLNLLGKYKGLNDRLVNENVALIDEVYKLKTK